MKKFLLCFLVAAICGLMSSFGMADPFSAGPGVPGGAMTPSYPLAGARTWVAYGDSIPANADTGNVSNGNCGAATGTCGGGLLGSWYTWVTMYTGQRVYRPVGTLNCGENGDTTATLLTVARLACPFAQHPDFILLAIGGNDAANSVTCAQFEINNQAIIRDFLNAGIAVIETSVYPRSSPSTFTTAEANLAQCYNLTMSQTAASPNFRGYYYVDVSGVMVDPTQTGSWASPSGCLTDGAHPGEPCSSAVGWLVARVVNSLVPLPVTPTYSAGDVYDATYNVRGNQLPNGLLTGTGGTAAGGVSGNVVASAVVTTGGLGGGAAVASIGTLSDGRPEQIVTVAGPYSGTALNVFFYEDASNLANFAVGDILEGSACVNIGSNVNITDVDVRLVTIENGTGHNSDSGTGSPGSTSGNIPTIGWASGQMLCLWTARRTMTAIPTKAEVQVKIDFVTHTGSSPLSAVVQIASVALRKVVP